MLQVVLVAANRFVGYIFAFHQAHGTDYSRDALWLVVTEHQ